MTNEEVKTFCQNKKINLNKFGKFSHSICIYSKEALYDLLDYNWLYLSIIVVLNTLSIL